MYITLIYLDRPAWELLEKEFLPGCNFYKKLYTSHCVHQYTLEVNRRPESLAENQVVGLAPKIEFPIQATNHQLQRSQCD